MKIIFWILLLCPFLIQAQSTKKVVNNLGNRMEKYYVLTSDKTTRHGSYESWRGFTKLLLGQYDFGKKIGLWQYFNDTGQLYQSYDFSKNKLVYYQPTTRNIFNYKLLLENIEDTVKLNRPPIRLDLTLYKGEHPKIPQYPRLEKEKGIEGFVKVRFVLDKEGFTSDYEIIESSAKAFRKDVLKYFEESPIIWLPAIVDNKPVDSEIIFNFKFKLN